MPVAVEPLPTMINRFLPFQINKPALPPQKKDCGTGIPCNWKVYASCEKEQLSTAYGENYYSWALLNGFEKTGNLHESHMALEPGYRNGNYDFNWFGPYKTKAVSSRTDAKWTSDKVIDHAVILYDPNPKQPHFKTDAKRMEKTLRERYPNITIELKPITSDADVNNALRSQRRFVHSNDGKETVAIYSTTHGSVDKDDKGGCLEMDEHGDVQGSTGRYINQNWLTEATLERHMQLISDDVCEGYAVIVACGSGAFADNDDTIGQ